MLMSPISWGEEGVMIRVALYSRKSNEQYGVAEGDKSVTRRTTTVVHSSRRSRTGPS